MGKDTKVVAHEGMGMGKGTKVVAHEGMGTGTCIFFINAGMGMDTVVPYPLDTHISYN